MNKIKSVLSSSSSSHSTDQTSPTTTSDPRRSSIDRDGSSRLSNSNSGGVATSGGATANSQQLPVQRGVEGRAEESEGFGQNRVSGNTGPFKDPHSLGHNHQPDVSNNFDLKTATHEHTHLGHKTHEHRHEHEVEEVSRVKDHERHVHHVQHHVQPVHDKQVLEEQHHHRAVPQTKIHEKHGSTKEDVAAFANLQTHKDETHHHGKDRQVVDLGETVNEKVHHHVHNVIQPVLHQEVHEQHRIHTTIPTHHVTHEAPIVHESIAHPVLNKADFLKQGGALGSNVTHENAGVLTQGGCDRTVDGVGEDLARELHLKSGTTQGEHAVDQRI